MFCVGRVAALGYPGPLHISDIGRGHAFSTSHHRPSIHSPSDRRWCTERVGGRAPTKSVWNKLLALQRSCGNKQSRGGDASTHTRQLTLLLLRCTACCLQLLPSSSQWLGHALQAFLRSASTPSTMVHADLDLLTCRVAACRVCAQTACCCSSLRLTRPRRRGCRPPPSSAHCRVARRGLRTGGAVRLARSTPLLLVVLRGACGVLGHLGVLNDACVSQ